MSSTTRQSMASAEIALGKIKGFKLDFSRELFAAADALHGSSQLRGALSDPSADIKRRQQLTEQVFSTLSKEVKGLINTLVAMRWSRPRDLATAVEQLGVISIAQQGSATQLIELGEELFSIQRLIETDGELELALSSSSAAASDKQALIEKLVSGKVSAEALLLANQAVAFSTSTSFSELLDEYAKHLARYAERKVATVSVARALTADQLSRLHKALAKAFDTELNLNVEIDEDVIGGIRVQVAGEVIDATVATKLNQARLQLS